MGVREKQEKLHAILYLNQTFKFVVFTVYMRYLHLYRNRIPV